VPSPFSLSFPKGICFCTRRCPLPRSTKDPVILDPESAEGEEPLNWFAVAFYLTFSDGSWPHCKVSPPPFHKNPPPLSHEPTNRRSRKFVVAQNPTLAAVRRFGQASPSFSRSFKVVDHENVSGVFCQFQFQTQLLLHCGEDARRAFGSLVANSSGVHFKTKSYLPVRPVSSTAGLFRNACMPKGKVRHRVIGKSSDALVAGSVAAQGW
jgi:hypothetical protein